MPTGGSWWSSISSPIKLISPFNDCPATFIVWGESVLLERVAASCKFTLLDVGGGKIDDAIETAVAASPYIACVCNPMVCLGDSSGVTFESNESILCTGDVSMTAG